MGLLPKRMRNNPVSAVSASPSFSKMIDRINEVRASDLPKLSNPRAVSPAMRLSLATFLEEWTETDIGHEKYIENLLSGFEANEAVKMGDLLEWMAIGTDGQFDNEVSLPKGAKHTELVGLHAELLDYLPLKSYNTFTMVTLLEDDPELVEEVFNNYVELTATEHDALQTLSNIVKRGSIESIRLLLEASPKHSEKGYGFTKTNNYGSMLVDTFELCRRAAKSYKDGNYMGAKALLGQLFDEKGIDAELVRMDLSKMAPMVLEIAGDGGRRGPGDLVLVSPMYAALTHKNLSSAKKAQEKGDRSAQQADVEFASFTTKNWGSEIKFERVGSNEVFRIKVQDNNQEESKKKCIAKLDKLLENIKGVTAKEILNPDVDDDKKIILTVIGKQITKITQAKRVTDSDEEGDDDDDELITATSAAESTPDDDKLTEQGIVDLVRKLGNMVDKGGGGGGDNNKGGKQGKNKKGFAQCKAKDLLQAIYQTVEQGTQAVFIIHATLSRSQDAPDNEKIKFKPDSNLIPKGTVTFTANRKGKGGTHINMVIEMLPGHEADRSPLVRDKVDPLDDAIEEILPETRRNPSDYNSQTEARQVAKIIAERGEPVYIWKRNGKWAVSQDHPRNVPANEVRTISASSKPKNNPQMPLVMGMPNARKLAQKYANELGVSAYIILDDSSSRKEKNYYTVTTDEQLGTTTLAQTWVIRPNGDASHTYGIKNPEEDEEWDMSVGAPVKKSKAEKSISEIIGKGKKTRIDSVELGYDDKEEQTRQILQKRKMDPEDWKESLERQGYGTNPKGGGKKGKASVGNTYAIDLIPRSSVKLGKKDVKWSNKLLHKWRDTSPEMKAFWKKYTATGAGGGNTVYQAPKAFKNKWFRMKKGETWNPNRPPLIPEMRTELSEYLPKSRFRDRQHFLNSWMNSLKKKGMLIQKPGTQAKGEAGESYVTYKKGKVVMRMIHARHKVSGSFVPYRLLVPAVAFRMEGDTLVARSGSKDAKAAKQLLELVTDHFGEIKFVKNKAKGGLKVGQIGIDEGVAKIFKTGGLYVSNDGAIARPYLFENNRITYVAKGRQYTLEVF